MSSDACDFHAGCFFFSDDPGMPEDLLHLKDAQKSVYCLNTWATCARRKIAIAVGVEHVPTDLYPHDHDYADETLTELTRNGYLSKM